MIIFPRFCRHREIVSSSSGFISTPTSRTTLHEVWQARYLVRQLIVRDLTVRYRQTWLGWIWAILNPALSLGLYYLVFGTMVHLTPPEYQSPYVLVLMSGLVLWMLFAGVVNSVSESLLHNVHLISKVWFPRSVLTLACTGVSLTDFCLAVLLLIIIFPLSGYPWVWQRLPVLVLCAGLTALAGWGLGCILAVARLRFRDVRHLVPLLMQALFYATPVVWTLGGLSSRGQTLATLNPLTGLIGLFRWVLPGGPLPEWTSLFWSVSGCITLALIGYSCFVRFESSVVDRE